MGVFSSWVDVNWLNLIQSIGVIGGLVMTAAAATRDAKSQEIANILTLSEHHRNLWCGIGERTELQRIFKTDVDLDKHPLNIAEEVFINEAMAHYMTGWRIAKAGGATTLRELATDVKWFFTLPLPTAVWEKNRQFKNHEFVQFVTQAIEPAERLKSNARADGGKI